jgi:hypothetical protein
MKISNKDCWLIIGPGRTGSKVIVDIIRNVYLQSYHRSYYFNPNSDLNTALKKIPINKIVHSHQVEFFYAFKKIGARIVLSKRNMIESALSWVIQREIGHWHIYDTNTLKGVTVSKTNFDYDFFMENYIKAKKFYENIKLELDDSIIIIDYDEFKDDSNAIVNKLNIDEYSTSANFKLSMKNPGSPSDWFLDWDTVSEKIRKLDFMPPL